MTRPCGTHEPPNALTLAVGNEPLALLEGSVLAEASPAPATVPGATVAEAGELPGLTSVLDKAVLAVVDRLAGGLGGSAPPVALPAAPQIATADVLVAAKDLGIGTALTAQDLQWQTWPTSAANPAFIRKQEHPQALEQFTGAIEPAS